MIGRFDLPVLERALEKAGLRFEWGAREIYDAQKIYHLHEKRDLTAAYQFYCNKELTEAHTALGDAQATLEIFTTAPPCLRSIIPRTTACEIIMAARTFTAILSSKFSTVVSRKG